MKKQRIFIGAAVFFPVAIVLGTYIFRTQLSDIKSGYTTQKFFSQSDIKNTVSPLHTNSQKPIVYGYLPYWTSGSAKISPVLTDISYFSLAIQPDGHLINIPKNAQESGYRLYQKGILDNLRQEISSSQHLELTLTMMDQEAIPIFLNDSSAQDRFLADLQTIVQTYKLDGINIDIEYNGLVDATLQDHLVTFLHRTKVLLKSQASPMSLSVATYSDSGNLQRVTHLQSIAPEVDHIIMMAYDYHRSNSPTAGPNSPIYGKTNKRWADDVMSNLKEYTQVVPPEKIILGIPFYGYLWSVVDAGNPNSFTLPKTGESVTYANILPISRQSHVERQWDEDALSPYLLFSEGQQTKVLYYEDAQSIGYKLQLVRQAGLGGIAIWAVGYEGNHQELWDKIQSSLVQ